MMDLSIHIQRIDKAHERLDVVDKRLTTLETVTAVAAERADNIKKSLEKIETGQVWIIRLVLGAIIAAILGVVMDGGIRVP